MKPSKLRRQITLVAARLIYERNENEYYRARIQAARMVSKNRVPAVDLPTNDEIRAEVRWLAESSDMRDENDIDVARLQYQVLPDQGALPDRFDAYHALLIPLETVKQSPRYHPEGDVLYHSLQVFELARNELPYDEEFLLAALLHDVGKAIDRHDHVSAGLDALDRFITQRTRWLILHHADAQSLREGTLGVRAARRLSESDSYEELLLLAQCDREGRRQGVMVPDVVEALQYVRSLETAFDP